MIRILTLALILSPVVLFLALRSPGDGLSRALQATLVLHSADDSARFLGSAFVYAGNEVVIVTNAHVIGDLTHVRITDANGASGTATPRAIDPWRDIAVLTTDAPLPPGLTASDAAGRGAAVYALGAPLGADFTLTQGIVSAPARQVEAHVPLRLLQHDAAVNPGSSGGPLVDATGGLVGMNSRIADGSRYYIGISYAIGAADLERQVALLLAGNSRPEVSLGLRARALNARHAAALGLAGQTGILVDDVAAGGSADHGGLRPGDVMVALDGALLSAPGDLAFALEGAPREQPISLAVVRDGAPLTLALGWPTPAAVERVAEEAQSRPPVDLTGLGLRLEPDGRVTEVTKGSAAYTSGLSAGDRIVALNGRGVTGAMIETASFTDPVLIRVQPGQTSVPATASATPAGITPKNPVDNPVPAAGQTRPQTHIMVDPWSRERVLRPLSGNRLDPEVVLF